MRLTGAIPKQSNSTAQIQPPPWLNLRRKPELDLLPLELDFLYGTTLYSILLHISLFSRLLSRSGGGAIFEMKLVEWRVSFCLSFYSFSSRIAFPIQRILTRADRKSQVNQCLVFLQLIFGRMNQLNKNPNIA